MMDDLSGLEWSAKPTGSQSKPTMNAPTYQSLRPTPSPLGSGRNTPISAQASAASAPKPAPAKPAQDSFSSLARFAPVKSTQNLSLAERQAQLEAEKRKKQEERRKLAEAQFGTGQFLDSLGSRGNSTSPALRPPPPSNGARNDDDDLFAAFNKDTQVDKASFYPPPESQRSTPGAPLDLSSPGAWGSATGSNGGSFAAAEDDDPFGLNDVKPRASAPPRQADDDDFLGDLGRPVDEVRMKQQASRSEPGKPIEDDDDDDDSSSSEEERIPMEYQPRVNKDPFDKAVAQLVDYGFSTEDAQRGLVESGTGFNAEAAANWLLDEAHRKSKEKAQGRSSSTNPSQSARMDNRPPANTSQSARMDNRSPASSGQPPRRDNRSPAGGDADLAKSAAAVGTSIFKTANSLWKTGQKKMQAAVAELQQEGDPSQPKWMRDAQQEQTRNAGKANANVTDEALMLEAGARPKPSRNNSRQAADPKPAQPPRGASPALSAGSRSSPAPRWQQQSAPPVMPDSRSRLNRLAAADDDDSFSSYVSANRRKKTTPSPQPPMQQLEPEPDLLFNSQAPKPTQTLPQRPAQPAKSVAQRPQPASRPSPRPSPRPAPRPARQVPNITPIALQTSTKHRLEGTAHFKLGDYAAAHSAYSLSLAAVPSTHPLMILLLTNRALTALKTGEPKQAVTDAAAALALIGSGNGHGETVAVKGETGQEENRDMKDLYGKALSRKAEALEQMEKWADAGAVWKACVEGGVGGATAVKGRQRCQNALAPKPKPAAKPAVRPKPSASASLAPQKDSEAVTRLRQANDAAAREDDERFALSEKVEARVGAWRDGKRDNLRALLSSMDSVLWENSGWKKVGLHELVVANKVKIAYMKAIAKTHPDKIAQDASTEVRLIAGLVFSTLNESWDKFKADNGL